MKKLFSFIFILMIPVSGFCDDQYFKSVKKRLIKDGFSQAYIHEIYKPANIKFQMKSTSLFFTVNEYKLNYKQFVSKKNIQNGLNYINKNKKIFQLAEKKFGVEPGIITAIITVETRLGKYTGNKKVINALSSIAALGDKNVRTAVKKSIPPKKNRYSAEKFHKRAIRKSDWAYKELKKLIKYSKANNMSMEKIKGSYAGATGIPQFMPSSILRYAVDGDGDGKIDLSTHEDAILSVASYMKSHGWTKGIKRDIALGVIMKYNKSRPYAETVYKLSKKIKGGA